MLNAELVSAEHVLQTFNECRLQSWQRLDCMRVKQGKSSVKPRIISDSRLTPLTSCWRFSCRTTGRKQTHLGVHCRKITVQVISVHLLLRG